MLLGVHDPDHVHGVIALVPSSVVNCGVRGGGTPSGCIGAAWTLGGKPLPYNVPPGIPSSAAVIPVEQIAGPILLACGGVDQVWPSCQSPRRSSAASKRTASTPHPSYTYLPPGHDIGTLIPYQPGAAKLDTNVPFDEQAAKACGRTSSASSGPFTEIRRAALRRTERKRAQSGKMGREGIEPSTLGLRVPCSTS